MTTPKHKQGDSSGSPSQTGSPSSSEELALTKIEKAKKGKYIRIKTWTDSSGSSMETHAKSITAAVKILRMSMRHHANWTLEFISEENVELCQPCPPSTPPCQETPDGQGLA